MARILVAFAAAALLLAPADAKQGKGKGQQKGRQKDAVIVFAPSHRSVVADYYRSSGLPPGLAKRNGDLPPGLEKQLRRNGRLPPGLEKKLAPFPPEIEMRLPPCPPDVRRGLIGGVAVMFSSRTGVILDAFAIAGR